MMQRGVVNRGVADDQVDQGARDFAERATTGPGLSGPLSPANSRRGWMAVSTIDDSLH